MLYVEQLKNRYRLIIRYIGVIIIGVGFIMLLPLLSLPFYPNEFNLSPYFIFASIIALVLGFLMKSISVNSKEEISLSLPEGGVIVVLSWFITLLLSTLPFIFSGMLSFSQAMFEAVSGWTTTGLSVVDVTTAPRIILLWRSIMQFFGGAGLAVVMLLAIIGPHGLGLYVAEGRTDKLLPNIGKSTRLIFSIYVGYMIVGTILYTIAGMPFFDSINHAMAALSTGGFSTQADSIGHYNSLVIEMITLFLMFAGTTNFIAHYMLLKGKFKKFAKIGEVKLMAFLLGFGIPIVTFVSLRGIYGGLGESFRKAIFELFSALTTTGFATVDYTTWPVFPLFIMIIFMMIGGGAGSTAGGIKLYRIHVLFKSLVWNIKSFLQPKNLIKQHYVNRPEGKYYVTKSHVLEISNFVFLVLITYLIGVAIFVAHGYPLLDSMFEFASCVGTVGLSVGITSATAPLGIMWTQIIGMILGRLEFFVIFLAIIKLIKDSSFIIKHNK